MANKSGIHFDLSNPDQKKLLILIILGLCFFGYVEFTYIIKAQMGAITKAKEEVTQLEQDLNLLHIQLARLQGIETQEAEAKKAVASFTKKFIRENEIVGLLQDISAMADAHRVRITQIKPTKEAFNPDEDTELPGQPLLMTLYAICDYHDLGRFINDLENGEVYTAVEVIKLTPETPDSLKQIVQLVVKTYVEE